jgi:hypothetical protein
MTVREFTDRHYDVLTGEVVILLVSMVLSVLLSVIL